MVNSRDNSPATAEYHSARSRTASAESIGNGNPSPAASSSSSARRRSFAAVAAAAAASLAPLTGGEGSPRIQVSSNTKRQFKDRRIYVNPRTGLPVRPPTSFGLFKHALRRAMGNKVDFSEFNRKATGQWSKMSEAEKEPYVQRAKDLLEHYKKVEVQFLRKKVREMLD